MEAGEFDVIDTMFWSEKREAIYDFGNPYAQIDVSIFFHEDITGIRGPEDLEGFIVAAKSGDNSIEILKKDGLTSIVEYPSYEKLIEAARDGKVKVFTVDRPPALYFLNKMGIQNRFRETKPLYHGELHRAVLKGKRGLLAVVENGFASIQKADYEAIDKRWMGDSIASTLYWRYAIYGVVAIVLLALMQMVWVWVLRRAVSSKTRALLQSEERNRSILQTALDGFCIVNMKGCIQQVNQAYCHMSGYSEEELLAMKISDLEVIETAEDIAKRMQDIIEKGAARFESKHRRKDGTVYFVEVSIKYRPDEGGQCVAFLRVISELKKAEEERAKLDAQLRQAQKMEAVGELAGGVAHDFNNILGAITGFGFLLNLQLKGNDTGTHYVSQILKAADRAAVLTQGLLAFSRKQHVNLQPMDLNATIRDTEQILTRTIGEDIQLSLRLTDQNTAVNADSNQINQILMNLATNARDAMPKGGTLTIGTARSFIDEVFMELHGYGNSGEYVVMTVTNSGMGMDSATLKRVFEPFFTTKAVGKGTGLGLSIVYGIVNQHNGFIDVSSEEGFGTTFKVYLPALEMRVEVRDPNEQFEPPAATETILVVEDDSILRQALTEMLQQFGHTVIEAFDGDDAVAKFLAHKDEIHLVIMDVIMPRKSGGDAYKELKAIQPDVKIILTSGYVGAYLSGKLGLEEDVHFIEKPVSSKRLFEKIRSVLSDEKA